MQKELTKEANKKKLMGVRNTKTKMAYFKEKLLKVKS